MEIPKYGIVHIHNKNDMYHLTRQILLDTGIYDPACFFYKILTVAPSEFNKTYSSFAFLIERSSIEADVYLNVDSKSLETIINYAETGKILGTFNLVELENLARMLGLTRLVEKISKLKE